MIDKAIGRRGILGFFLGAGAASVAPQVVTVKAAAAALGVPVDAPANEAILGSAGVPLASGTDAFWNFLHRVEANHYSKQKPVSEMPPHISTKRSWSPAFKQMIYSREEAIMRAYCDALRQDVSFRDKVMTHVFGGGHDAG